MGVTLIHSNEYVLAARTGLDREATGEVRGSPVRAGDSEGDSVGGGHAIVSVIGFGGVSGLGE